MATGSELWYAPRRVRELEDIYRAARETGFVRRLLELARDEDLGTVGDLTSDATIAADAQGRYAVVPRSAAVMAGLATIPDIIKIFAPRVTVEFHAKDGDRASPGVPVATLTGPVREILAMERPMLNLVSRLSGIATRTAAFVAAMGPRPNGKPQLCDTRKTTPGLRVLEKYAVRCGGGQSHRMGLFDAVLIKDNHLAGVGAGDFPVSVRSAIERVMATGVKPAFVQVEVDSLEQFQALLSAPPPGLGMVLLDNMDAEMLKVAVRMRDTQGSLLVLEASGGVTLETIRGIADTGVDRVSVGSLTHGAVSVDLGLDAC